MRRIAICALLLAFCSLPHPAAGQRASGRSAEIEHSLVFLSSGDNLGAVDRDKLKTAFHLMLGELKLPPRDLPHIVVLHVSQAVGHGAGVEATCVRRVRDEPHRTYYYELWIVGQPGSADYALGMYAVLTLHFGLSKSVEQQREIVARVTRHLDSTLNARSPMK